MAKFQKSKPNSSIGSKIGNGLKTVGRYAEAGMLGIEGVNPNIAFNPQDKARNAALGNKIKSTAQKIGDTVEKGLKPIRNYINKPAVQQPAAAGLAAKKLGGKIAGKSFMKHYKDIEDFK